MRTLVIVLIVLAAVAFLIGAYCAFGSTVVIGKPPATYWRGAVGFLLFAITLMLFERGKA